MSDIVEITVIPSGFRNVADRVEIGNWEFGEYAMSGAVCRNYRLPDGYRVAESNGGLSYIYPTLGKMPSHLSSHGGNVYLDGHKLAVVRD